MSLAVTGTDTEVGKTVVSALLLARYGGGDGRGPRYWKPVATGADDELDTATVARLAPAGCDILPEAYSFDPPVSPHLAARLADRELFPGFIQAQLIRHLAEEPERQLLVEGIGGLLVPLNDRGVLLADLLADLELPCLLVARSTLGTINHTLLSLEAMRQRRIPPVGVVLVGPPDEHNREAVERFGKVTVIGELPLLDPLDRQAVARAAGSFDPQGRLRPYLAPLLDDQGPDDQGPDEPGADQSGADQPAAEAAIPAAESGER